MCVPALAGLRTTLQLPPLPPPPQNNDWEPSRRCPSISRTAAVPTQEIFPHPPSDWLAISPTAEGARPFRLEATSNTSNTSNSALVCDRGYGRFRSPGQRRMWFVKS